MIIDFLTELIWYSKPESKVREDYINSIYRFFNKEWRYNKVYIDDVSKELLNHRTETHSDKQNIKRLIQEMEVKVYGKKKKTK